MKTIEKLIDSLRKAAIELEKLQVQMALGKAEAGDRYEQARKDFFTTLEEAKKIAKGKYEDLKPTLEALEVQFALGKAEAKEKLKDHAGKFSQVINQFETFLKKI